MNSASGEARNTPLDGVLCTGRSLRLGVQSNAGPIEDGQVLSIERLKISLRLEEYTGCDNHGLALEKDRQADLVEVLAEVHSFAGSEDLRIGPDWNVAAACSSNRSSYSSAHDGLETVNVNGEDRLGLTGPRSTPTLATMLHRDGQRAGPTVQDRFAMAIRFTPFEVASGAAVEGVGSLLRRR